MTTQAILGIIFLVLTISPLVYFGKVAKNRSQKAKKNLETLALSNQCVLDDIEFWNDKGIGIDNGKKILFYSSLQENNKKNQIVAIKQLKHCSVSLKKTAVDLILETKNDGQIERIQLFDQAVDDANEAGFHHQLAIKWSKKITELIERKKDHKLRKSA